MILPDLDYSLDTLKVGSSIDQFPDQVNQVIHEMATETLPANCSLVDNIVVSGMGGSALGGRILSGLEKQTLKIPLVVSTEYHLPNFVNQKSLVVISSYSGNTEESLSCLAEAEARNAQIFILSSGGRLAFLADEHHLPHYVFTASHNPSHQPRLGLGYSTTSLLMLLARCQLIHPARDINELPKFLKSLQTSDNLAHYLSLARELSGRIPVIMCSEHLKGPVHAFKNMLNENAKTFAVMFDLPEANHHLLEGLTFPPGLSDKLSFLFVESDKYHPELIRRYPLTKNVIAKHKISLQNLIISGPNRLFESFAVILACSYIAYYLSLIQGVDPGPIPWVDWYKDELRKESQEN